MAQISSSGAIDTIKLASTAMVDAFLQNYTEFTFAGVTQFYPSYTLIDNGAAMGAFPMMSGWRGSISVQGAPQFSYTMPNCLYKVASGIDRTAWIADQIGAINTFITGAGLEITGFYQRKFAAELLRSVATGGATSMNVQQDGQGPVYTSTLDAKPFFSTQHVYPAGAQYTATQANIVNGTLPATVAAFQAETEESLSSMFKQDLNVILNYFANVKNTNGDLMYKSLLNGARLEIHVPPIMAQIAQQVFGTNLETIINATSNVSSSFVAKVRCSPYYTYVPDPDNGNAILQPLYPTQYYAFLVNPYARPFLGQNFMQLPPDSRYPWSGNQNAANERYKSGVKALKKVFPAEMGDFASYAAASTIVDTTLQMQGAQAIPSTIGEQFLVAPRWQGQFRPVYWTPALCVMPTGATLPAW